MATIHLENKEELQDFINRNNNGECITLEEINFEKDLEEVLENIKKLLIDKNKKYGDSALDPLRIFSKANPDEQLKVRIDDKLNRLSNNIDGDTEDTELDLIGYFILLRIYKLRESRKNND